MTETRFTDDNTEGYDAADLAKINLMFDERVVTCADDLTVAGHYADNYGLEIGRLSMLDAIAEDVLCKFDSEADTSTIRGISDA